MEDMETVSLVTDTKLESTMVKLVSLFTLLMDMEPTPMDNRS